MLLIVSEDEVRASDPFRLRISILRSPRLVLAVALAESLACPSSNRSAHRSEHTKALSY